MKEKVTKKLETRAAELVILIMLIVVLLSSCGTTGNCGGRGNAWSANCPAYR